MKQRYKKIGLVLGLFILLSSFSAWVVFKYTNKEVGEIVTNIVEDYEPFEYNGGFRVSAFLKEKDVNEASNYWSRVSPIYLGELLFHNNTIVHNRFDNEITDRGFVGLKKSEDAYNNGWRNYFGNNPAMLKYAWGLIGEQALVKINSKILYFKDSPNAAIFSYDSVYRKKGYESSKFTPAKFWEANMNLLGRYKKLIAELESLSDRQLRNYIESCDSRDKSSSYEFEKWLIKKNLINNDVYQDFDVTCAEAPTNNLKYPGDLLMLIKRSCENYPNKLTYRGCLTIANELIIEIEKSVKGLGYVE